MHYNFRETAPDQILSASRYLLEIALANALRARDPAYRASFLFEASQTLLSQNLLRAVDLLRFQKHRERTYFTQWSNQYHELTLASSQKKFFAEQDASAFQKRHLKQLQLYEQLVTGQVTQRLVSNDRITSFFFHYYQQGFRLMHSQSHEAARHTKLSHSGFEELFRMSKGEHDKSEFPIFWELLESILSTKLNDHKQISQEHASHHQAIAAKTNIIQKIRDHMSETLQPPKEILAKMNLFTQDSVKQCLSGLLNLVSGYHVSSSGLKELKLQE